jgi:hypothetical protein
VGVLMNKILALMMFVVCIASAILLAADVVPPLPEGIQSLFVALLGISLGANLILVDNM